MYPEHGHQKKKPENVNSPDGYVIYGTQYEKDPEKLKVIRNKNRTSWTYTLTQGKTNYLNFMIRGFKRTKSGIVLYTPYICGYMA